MKNRLIRNRHQALVMLATRVLPSETAINKVSVLLTTRFEAAFEATEVARKKIITDHPAPDGWEGEGLPEGIAATRQTALDTYLELGQPIRKIPDRLRLKKADLPRVLKREGGESNVEGLAQIVVLLGSLYVREGEDIFKDDDGGGDEPDELAPASPQDDFAPAVAE